MMKKKAVFWGVIYVIALFAVMVIVYVLPPVAGLFDRSYVAKYGSVEVQDDADGYMVRNETVYTAGKAGTVKHSVNEGELIKGTTNVIKLSGEGADKGNKEFAAIIKKMDKDRVVNTVNGNAEHPGYVSYNVDGLEYLNESNIHKLTEKKLDKLGKAKPEKLSEGKVAKGDPVFKIIENGSWWYVFYADRDVAKHYAKGQNVKIEIGGKKMDAIVEDVQKSKKDSGNVRIVLRSRQYFDRFISGRQENAKITAAGSDGVVIETRSIVEKNGNKGVVIKDKVGRLQFKPVSIKADNGKQAAVFEDIYMDSKGNYVKTISTYDEVVKSPSKRDIRKAKDVSK